MPNDWQLKYNYPSTGKISLAYTSTLPLTLVYCKGDLSENGVLLHWQTSSEIHNHQFKIERSQDALIWQKVDFGDGNGGFVRPVMDE